VKARFVQFTSEHFQPDDGVDDDDEKDEKGDVGERNHRHQN
jgi:hypothetical protein